MNLKQCYLTKNQCYQVGKKITPKGFMLHSTGANNPNLKRYVPDFDGTIGTNANGNHWNTYQPGGRQVCVHGFIGKLANGDVATVQTLPWNMRGWHCGGTGNNTYIGVEICEDGLTDSNYFNKVYNEAVELAAMLTKKYGWNVDTDVICHSEGYKKRIASNHSDVMHWFPKHNKSMDTFRADVKAKLNSASTSTGTNTSTNTNVPKKAIKYVYNCDELNVRTGAGTNYKAVNSLACRTAVKVYEVVNGWARIEKGMWVSNKYLASKISNHIKSMEVYNCSSLNVRKTPNGTIVGNIPVNCVVSVLETRNGWTRIGANRWVYSKYLK